MNCENRSSGGGLAGYPGWKSPASANAGVIHGAGAGEMQTKSNTINNDGSSNNNNVDGNAWTSRSVTSTANNMAANLTRRQAGTSSANAAIAYHATCPPSMPPQASLSSPLFLPSTAAPASSTFPVSSPVVSGYFHPQNVAVGNPASTPTSAFTAGGDAVAPLPTASPNTVNVRFNSNNNLNSASSTNSNNYTDGVGLGNNVSTTRMHNRGTNYPSNSSSGLPFPIAPTGLHRRGESNVSSERAMNLRANTLSTSLSDAVAVTSRNETATGGSLPSALIHRTQNFPHPNLSHRPHSSVSDTSAPGFGLSLGADMVQQQGGSFPSFVSYTPQGFDPAPHASTNIASGLTTATTNYNTNPASSMQHPKDSSGQLSFVTGTPGSVPFVQPTYARSGGLPIQGSGFENNSNNNNSYNMSNNAMLNASGTSSNEMMGAGVAGGLETQPMPVHTSSRHLMGDSTVPLHHMRGRGNYRHRAGRTGALFRLLRNVFMHDVAGMDELGFGSDSGGDNGGGVDRDGKAASSRPPHQTRFGNPADDLPLLEELGVVPWNILNKALAVLNPLANLSASTLKDTDLAGPAVCAIALACLLSLQGKMQFSAIYGLCVLGVIMFKALLSLMHDTSVPLPIIMSSLGYALIPNLLLAALRAAQFWIFGSPCRGLLPLALFVILWSSWCATTLIVKGHDMISQRYLILYPMVLFYAVFAVLTIF